MIHVCLPAGQGGRQGECEPSCTDQVSSSGPKGSPAAAQAGPQGSPAAAQAGPQGSPATPQQGPRAPATAAANEGAKQGRWTCACCATPTAAAVKEGARQERCTRACCATPATAAAEEAEWQASWIRSSMQRLRLRAGPALSCSAMCMHVLRLSPCMHEPCTDSQEHALLVDLWKKEHLGLFWALMKQC